MSDKKSGGISLSGLLLVAFIVLKLCGVISWSWWWVMAPLWLPIAVIAIACGIAFAIVKLFD